MFAVKFTLGEKRGLESKTNKCVLYYRRSENFPISGNWAASRLLPKVCPVLWESEFWLASCHGGFQQGSTVLSSGPALFPHTCPWLPSLPANSAPQLSRAGLKLPPLSHCLICFCSLSRSPVVFASCSPCWVQIQSPWCGPTWCPWVVLFYLFSLYYYSPNFICLLAIHIFLFLQWSLSLYRPVLKSML